MGEVAPANGSKLTLGGEVRVGRSFEPAYRCNDMEVAPRLLQQPNGSGWYYGVELPFGGCPASGSDQSRQLTHSGLGFNGVAGHKFSLSSTFAFNLEGSLGYRLRWIHRPALDRNYVEVVGLSNGPLAAISPRFEWKPTDPGFGFTLGALGAVGYSSATYDEMSGANYQIAGTFGFFGP